MLVKHYREEMEKNGVNSIFNPSSRSFVSLRGTNRPLERANKKIAKEAACPVRNSVAMRVFLVE